MSDPKPIPYPADTRAKGWRFELDYEAIEQSTTWSRAKPEARPWLLMLWMVSWKQVPCGSLPDDPEAIAGAIGIPDELWDKFQPALMRGWWKADDGRLYHDTLIKRVFEMVESRRKDTARRAGNRAKAKEADRSPDDVPRDTCGTPGDVQRDSTVSPDTGTGTSTSQQDKLVERARASRLPADWTLPPEWADFCRTERPDLRPEQVAALFADHWRSAPGASARKLDWFATWRNWVRKERAPPRGAADRTAEHTRVIDELTGGLMSRKPQENSRATGEVIDV